MGLLDLPPELLQLVFRHCTTVSFLQLSLTCRSLFAIACSARAVILHHLSQVPGLPAASQESPTASTAELFLLLRRRAASHLYGADFHADRVIYNAGGGSIDPPACAVRLSGDPNLALVERGKHLVHLYHLTPGAIRPVCRLEPPPEYTGKIQVLRVIFAHDKQTISVLTRFEPNHATTSVQVHPYVKEALRHFHRPGTHLIHYRRKAPGGPFCYITLAGFADHDINDGASPDLQFEPLAIDVAHPLRVAVCWRHPHNHNLRKVFLHTADPSEDGPLDQKLTALVYNSTLLVDPSGLKPQSQRPPSSSLNQHGPIVKLRFNDRCSQLLYYHASATIYRNYQLVYDTCLSDIHRNNSIVPYPVSESEGDPAIMAPFAIDIPIFYTHETYPVSLYRNMCRWQYLALGTAMDRQADKPIAVLVRSKAECHAFRCQHIPNLERGRRLEHWTMVARLLDYDASSSTSLAGTVAASHSGTRLAIATWKTIRVWAFEPSELITSNANHFYPACMEHAPGVVDLEPIVLHADAVIFSLAFVGETELVCVTDKGVLKWDLGPCARGQRLVDLLPDTPPVPNDEFLFEPDKPDPEHDEPEAVPENRARG
ncbi:hypothetical protein VTO42DRAFT_8599 [Malbranchea cinnamomea]